MVEYGITPETVHLTADLVSLLAIGYLGFSAGQRGAIKYRDNKECQMDCPLAQHCGGHHDNLEIHHVRPRRWLKDHGFPEHEIDSARNGISVCKTFHRKEIHGFRNHEVQRRVNMGVPYWDTKHDLLLAKKADINTDEAEARGWKFPQPSKTKTIYTRKKRGKWLVV